MNVDAIVAMIAINKALSVTNVATNSNFRAKICSKSLRRPLMANMTIIVYKLLLQTFKLFITYQIMSICKIPSFFLLNIFKTNVKLNYIFLEVKKIRKNKVDRI